MRKFIGLISVLALVGLLVTAFVFNRNPPPSGPIDYNVDQGPFFKPPPEVLIQVDRSGPSLPKIDEIEIDRLGGFADSAKQNSVTLGYKIVASKTVHNREARDIVDCWRTLPRTIYLSDLCHEPVYGLRFRYKGKLLLETTICWNCHNYDWIGTNGKPYEWGFDADSETAQRLLKLLKDQVPLPPKPDGK